MARSKNKTIENNTSVSAFIKAVEKEQKRKDAIKLNKIFSDITKTKAKMWGTSIIGYGKYHYKYESGREGDFLKIGFSPRKANLSLYIMNGAASYPELLKKLGKHKASKGCLYINKLEDVDLKILEKIIKKSWEYMCKKYD